MNITLQNGQLHANIIVDKDDTNKASVKVNDMGDLVDIQAVGVGQTDVYINIGGKVAKCHVVVK